MARKGKWDYKPESWKHMSKRNDYGCMVIIMIFCCLIGITSCCVGCSKEDEGYDSPNSNETNESENTIDKIAGVWESLNNDLFFISISPQGRVSYCFSQYTMGIGYGTLKNGELVIENDYSGYSDKLYMDITGEIMNLRGLIKKKKTDENEGIKLSFKKVNEKNVYSFIGQFWNPGVSMGGGYTSESLSFVGDCIAQYKRYKRQSWEVSYESLWYCVPRNHHSKGQIVYFTPSNSSDSYIGVRNKSLFTLYF
ncbi:hypothetical protein [Bacteroides sp. BFG-606]|uniref:hypothetical protein n=1 Tax=Bacteroides sp. BFG-606 TaxID=2972763 RepID=UPI0021661283|nr:hypothetical protein [Bacteroides sp. BFG-606]MCS2333628.1 hypothetical protein [Bacteroides sp. BFG-606]